VEGSWVEETKKERGGVGGGIEPRGEESGGVQRGGPVACPVTATPPVGEKRGIEGESIST